VYFEQWLSPLPSAAPSRTSRAFPGGYSQQDDNTQPESEPTENKGSNDHELNYLLEEFDLGGRLWH
jgi:hypothetical protein